MVVNSVRYVEQGLRCKVLGVKIIEIQIRYCVLVLYIYGLVDITVIQLLP